MHKHSHIFPQAVDFASEWNWFAHEAHALAITKGWWQASRSLLECMALVISEVGEAVEAFRAPGCSKKILAFSHAEEEIADILIRLADLTCAFMLPVDSAIRSRIPSLPSNGLSHSEDAFAVGFNQAAAQLESQGNTHLNPLEHLGMASAYLGEAIFFFTQDDDDDSASGAICNAILELMVLANEQNYNLAEAIIAKHRYNTARQFRHGNKLY
jgi:hypothetical protein